MIAPMRMSNVLLNNLFSSQFAADNDVLIIPTTARAELFRGGGQLVQTMITPLLEFIRQSLFRSRWHVYVLVRNSHFIGVHVDRTTSHLRLLWYVDSLK